MSTVALNVRIRHIILRDRTGMIINPVKDVYFVMPNEQVKFELSIERPSGHDMDITYRTIPGRGTISTDGIYVASDKSESKDIITIKIEDPQTHKTDYRAINIQVMRK
jgi:hypothetical protein